MKKDELVKSIKATKTFKSTYANGGSLLTSILELRFNKPTLDELSDYQLEEFGKYLKKLDAMQTGKKEMVSKNQITIIETLWSKNNKDKDEKALLAHTKKTLKRDVKALADLTKKEADLIIGGLKNGTK